MGRFNGGDYINMNNENANYDPTTAEAVTDGQHGSPRVSSETRPQNVYVNFIIKY